jgi:hypothetical protein
MTLTRVMAMMLVGGLAGLLHARPALAQQADRIGVFVIDARGAFMSYDVSAEVSEPLGLETEQLPSRGLGFELGAHVYPIRSQSVALGLGATLLFTRGSEQPDLEEGQTAGPDDPTVETRIQAFTPQVSLNFGSRRGYSYVSGGIGTVTRTIEATEGRILAEVSDATRVRALNYGGGARWFAASHVAFSFDLRFYQVSSQEATTTNAALPSQRLFVASVGISIH